MDIMRSVYTTTRLQLALFPGAFAEEAPRNSVDHAGIIQSLDQQDFEAGQSQRGEKAKAEALLEEATKGANDA